MRLCLILGILLLLSPPLLAQKEANVWYFGKRAGFDFSSGSPKAIKGNMMDQWEGSSVLCDSTGKVILYSDGQWVWNGNHQLVTNGQGLMGEQTSTQSALIVAKPGSKNLYYLFTASHTAMRDGLFYNVIDMTRQGGTGEVIEKNVLIHKPTTEKLTAYPHRNGRDLWILTHPWNTASFYAYLLTPNGLSPTPVVSQVGAFQGDYDPATGTQYSGEDYIGYLKVSPDGSRTAQAIKGIRTFELFDFNNATGKISNPITLRSEEFITPYGVEFSPDGTKLYGTTEGTRALFQWDLSAGSPQAIAASRVQLATMGWDWEHLGGALQTGPDGKIYVAKVKNEYVGIIQHPNAAGAACGYIDKGISVYAQDVVYRLCHFGLPNIVASTFKLPAFTFEGLCFSESTQFRSNYTYGVDSVRWQFGDPATGTRNTSALFHPTHVFSKPGTYRVTFLAYRNGLADTVTKEVTIKPLPVVELGRDTLLCTRNELLLKVDVPGGSYHWNDGSTQSSLLVSEPGVYSIEVTKDGCTATDSIKVDFAVCPVKIPNVFTPNGDGYNDTFMVEGLVFGRWRLEVYDRWGKVKYVNPTYRNEWNGNDLAGGMYFYLLTDAQLNAHYKGWVHLLR